MAKCAICDKGVSHGNKISIARSHVSRRAARTWKPNLRSVKAIVKTFKYVQNAYVLEKLKEHN